MLTHFDYEYPLVTAERFTLIYVYIGVHSHDAKTDFRNQILRFIITIYFAILALFIINIINKAIT